MKGRQHERLSAARLAWYLWAACLVLVALALLLDFLRAGMFLSDPWQVLSNNRFLYPIYAVLTGMLSLVYPTIGALIVSRLSRNPIGWIFCAVGLLYQLHHFALAYSNYVVADGFTLPWGKYAAWFSAWVGFAGLILAGGGCPIRVPGRSHDQQLHHQLDVRCDGGVQHVRKI